MAKFLVISLCLIFLNAHLILAEDKQTVAEAPTGRKLGKHVFPEKIAEPGPGLENVELSREVSVSGEATGPVSEEEVMKTNHHRHHSFDKSVAGGGVILGGLATTFLVAIFCYIRATRRKSAEPGSPSSLSSSVGRKNVEHDTLSN